MDMVYILDQWIVVRIFYSLSCGIAEIFPSMPIKSSNIRWHLRETSRFWPKVKKEYFLSSIKEFGWSVLKVTNFTPHPLILMKNLKRHLKKIVNVTAVSMAQSSLIILMDVLVLGALEQIWKIITMEKQLALSMIIVMLLSAQHEKLVIMILEKIFQLFVMKTSKVEKCCQTKEKNKDFLIWIVTRLSVFIWQDFNGLDQDTLNHLMIAQKIVPVGIEYSILE